MNKPPAIGIDLGTINSSVAVFQYDMMEIIANEQGYRTTPSCVVFNGKEKFIGNQAVQNKENVICNVKRFIGRKFEEMAIQEDKQHLPFNLTNDDHGKPNIKIKYGGKPKDLSLEQISAFFISKMKEIAENYIGTEVIDAVISVPACFNDSQRQATLDAGAIAGLNVLRLINEPTAVAITYGMERKPVGEKNVLIVDLGGGTFDVSVVTLDEGLFEVKATSGNSHFGGEDFNSRMVNYFASEFRLKHSQDLTENRQAMSRLRRACEQAKQTLSTALIANIQIDSLFAGIDFTLTITRGKFEKICSDLFKSILLPVENVLRDAMLDKTEIHDIVLVGGSTKMPKVQQILKEFFNGKQMIQLGDPEGAVAYGAAVQAAILSDEQSEVIENMLVLDVIPLSIRIPAAADQKTTTTLIKRNTALPTRHTTTFTTSFDDQTSILVQVFEGEHNSAIENHLLGKFQLNGIPKAPKRLQQIEVTLDIDFNGILSISANDQITKKKININQDKGRLSGDQINRMVQEAAMYRENDEDKRNFLIAKIAATNYIFQIESTMKYEAIKSRIYTANRNDIKSKIEDITQWMKVNLENSKELESKLNAIKELCYPILSELYNRRIIENENLCMKTLNCGHVCHGVKSELQCLPCLYGCSGDLNGDDSCTICYTDSLFEEPTIQLGCNHLFHLQCIQTLLEKRWVGDRISFAFSLCPICKTQIEHRLLTAMLAPIREMYEDVKRKAVLRLQYEGLSQCPEITTPGGEFYNDPAGFALKKYAYFLCFKCDKAYFGGEARCNVNVDDANFKPEDLLCGSCSNVTNAQICTKHGPDFLGYKCRYCCSEAVWFCHGTTHYCNTCHGRSSNTPCPAGPGGVALTGPCPLGIKHPPSGVEFLSRLCSLQ